MQPTSMTDQTARRVIELSEKATKGPWKHSTLGYQVATGDSWSTVCTFSNLNQDHRFATWENGQEPESGAANAELIAFYRIAAPELARAYLKLREVADGLADVLLRLYDHQNGCPLPKYEKEWNQAMKDADARLDEYRARVETTQSSESSRSGS